MEHVKRFDFGPHIRALEELERRSVRGSHISISSDSLDDLSNQDIVGRAMRRGDKKESVGIFQTDDYQIPEILRKQIASDLPPVKPAPSPPKFAFELDEVDDGPIAFDVEGGEVIVWPLYTRRGSISVVKSFIPAGIRFPVHIHGEVEVILVYEGSIRYRSKMLRDRGIDHRDVYPGECVRVIENIPHEVKAIEDSWVIAITVPDSPGLPRRYCKSCPETLEGLEAEEAENDGD